jgi:sugar lactone lactonase YvrE
LLLALAGPSAAAEFLVSSFNSHQVLRYDATSGAFLGSLTTQTTIQPKGLDVDSGRVYVATGNGNPIVVVSASGGGLIVDFQPDASCFPTDVTVGPDGNIYTVCYDIPGLADRVIESDPNGLFLGTFVPPGTAPVSRTAGFAFGPDGRLYVTSEANDRVARFDGTSGAFIDSLPVAPVSSPNYVTVGPDGKLYVAGRFSSSVVRIDPGTGAVTPFVSSGSGGLSSAGDLEFGPDGNLYVASINTDSVLRYHGTTGAFLGTFVAAGSGGLSAPIGIAFSPPAALACLDADGDGFGSPGNAACPSGAADDCNDSSAAVNPNALELPGNFTDENCDGDLGQCDPCSTWPNHGQYVRCVAQAVEVLVGGGLIDEEGGDALVASAAQSEIGKRNFVPPQCP